MFNIGFPELIVIVVVALLVVGPQKLPELAKALGKGFSEFRKATDDVTETIKETLKADDVKNDLDDIRNSLLYGKKDNYEDDNQPASPSEEKKEHSPKDADIKTED